MADLKPRDVVEIAIGQQKAYAQMIHNHPSYPPVVRALDGLRDKHPADLDSVVAGKTRFVAMIPLATALPRAGSEIENLGTFDIPEEHRAFPTFRMPIRDKQGEIVYWWFWDGRGLSYDVELSEAQESLPIHEVMTGSRFLELIAG